jgi:RNA polymerase sigma-70 factor (ECF subfamily)
MAQPSDEELVGRAKRGDRKSFEALVERHKRMVFNIAWRILRNRENAEDAAQEAFLRAFRSVGTFRGQAAFSSWLYQITTNTCLSFADSAYVRRTVGRSEEDLQGSDRQLPDGDTSPEEIAAREDFGERIRGLVEKLPPMYRAVVTLYYLNDQSYREVAKILGIPLGSVKTRLHRAKRLLRECVLEHYEREELW